MEQIAYNPVALGFVKVERGYIGKNAANRSEGIICYREEMVEESLKLNQSV
jgi:hypothetical protein